MKKIISLFLLVSIFTYTYSKQGEDMKQVKLKINNYEIIFELNVTKVSEEFYNLLPLEVKISNYSNNEKVFDIPKVLDTSDAEGVDPKTGVGTLAYFKPWNGGVIYYGKFSEYPGLYELGKTIRGKEYIHRIPEGRYILDKLN